MIRLERERLARGWSKSRLAREAELNQVTVVEITNGVRRPGPTQLAKLASALHWPISRARELIEETEV